MKQKKSAIANNKPLMTIIILAIALFAIATNYLPAGCAAGDCTIPPTSKPKPTPKVTPAHFPSPAITYTPIGNPDLGIFNREAVDSVDDPLLKWQIIASPSILLNYSKSKGVFFNFWSDWSKSKSKWTDIGPDGFIEKRFALANKYKKKFEYAPFLLQEEMYGPIALSTTAEPLNTWKLEGNATFNGVEVKLLKTWIIENKGKAWDQNWWNGLKGGSSDPLLKEWEKYYTTNLYRAWNEYIHSLGKKTAVIGVLSLKNKDYEGDLEYSMPANKYVFANYDAIIDYSYPNSTTQISYSLNKIKFIRSKFKGKIFWVLTSNFPTTTTGASWWSTELARSEFKAVAPYADVILTYPFVDMHTRTNPYPQYLISFYETWGQGVKKASRIQDE